MRNADSSVGNTRLRGTGRDDTMLTVPFTRGSTRKLRPVMSATALTTASMSAFTKLSVTVSLGPIAVCTPLGCDAFAGGVPAAGATGGVCATAFDSHRLPRTAIARERNRVAVRGRKTDAAAKNAGAHKTGGERRWCSVRPVVKARAMIAWGPHETPQRNGSFFAR